MKYQLAELNIAQFRLPKDHPDNADFINALDRVNAVAESQPGFVWRFTGGNSNNSAIDVQAYDDPNIAVNVSVWTDIKSLAAFVYRSNEHREIMRRRSEWFEKIDFTLVLWWVESGHIPTVEEAKERLVDLQSNGPSPRAFTFKQPYPSPDGELIKPIQDECA